MGLGGRREKQRITDDPRNTKWINDESSPGQRLLRSMGWKPEGDSDTASNEPKTGLMAHNGTKRLRAIPIPKSGMEGIGYRPNGPSANVGLGALPSSTGNRASAASSVFARMGSKAALQFVSAGASKEVINRAKTEGGEFAGLLSRLNASASATPAASDGEQANEDDDQEDRENQPSMETKEERKERKRKRKLEKEAKRDAKRLRKDGALSSTGPTTATSTPGLAEHDPPINQVIEVLEQVAAKPAFFNPRMASRARHLASKRMLNSDANALAEILGIAPTPPSGASTPSSSLLATNSLPATKPASKEATPSVLPFMQPASGNADVSQVTDAEAEAKARRKAERRAARQALNSFEPTDSVASDGGSKIKKSKKRKSREE